MTKYHLTNIRSPYCLTKYALEGFHDVLRYEMRAFGVNVSPTLKLVIVHRNWRKHKNIIDKNSDIFHFDGHSHDLVKVSVLEPGNFIAGTNIFNETFVNSQVLKTIVTVSVSVFVIVFISVFYACSCAYICIFNKPGHFH